MEVIAAKAFVEPGMLGLALVGQVEGLPQKVKSFGGIPFQASLSFLRKDGVPPFSKPGK